MMWSSCPSARSYRWGIDHGVDLAQLEAGRGPSEVLYVAILDFADASIAIPVHEQEGRFNCALIPAGIRRARRAVDPFSGLQAAQIHSFFRA